MGEGPGAGDAGALVAALHAVSVGLVLLDRDLRLVTATGPLAQLLPRNTDRLHPGSDWSDVIAPEAALLRGHDVAAALQASGVVIGAERLAEGGALLMIRADPAASHGEPRLSDVIEGGTVGTWEWEVPTGRLRVNDRWITMLGRSRASIGPIDIDTWRQLLHPADRSRMEAKFAGMTDLDVRGFDEAFRLRHADGSWVWVQSRGQILRRDASGQPVLMAGVHLDITVQKTFEQRLEHVLEGAQVGTWQFDEVKRTNQVDARWAEMLGYTQSDIAAWPGNAFADLLHPDDLPQLMAEQDGRKQHGLWSFDNEFRLRHKQGHWVWVLSRGRVTEWSEDGRPLVTSGVHIDISERKALAEDLARERDFLAGLMDSSISGIVALDAEGCVNFVNREAEIVMGRPAEFLLGRSCADKDWGLTDPAGQPLDRDTSPFHLAVRSGLVQRGVNLGLRMPDGSLRQLLVNAAPVRREGIAARVVCAVVDITEAMAAEAALRAAMERAEAGNRAKSAFLATMSHEIRTPLNGVLGMADVLGATLTEPDQRAMLQTIQQSGAHLLAILNDILDLAKIEAGRMALDLAPFTPVDLVAKVEALHGITARGKGIDLQVLGDAGALAPRMGDAQRVAQVLHNLVSNAVKFTETGWVRVMVAAPAGGPVVLEVADSGIGMTKAQTDVVFEDFVQADDTITRRFGGTGLGLPIVRNLVNLMGGTLQLRSAPGAGTAVRVELPLPLAEVARPDARKPPQSLSRLRALVAEDNATNRVILRSMLTALGVRFTLVEDGRQALAAWAPDLFDILLLDISMPHLDGISALQSIAERARASGVDCPPALAVTANAMTHHVAEYADAGFVGCVAKPLRLEDLSAAIARAVSEPEPG